MTSTRAWMRALPVLLTGMLCASAALAADFEVAGMFLRPAFYKNATGSLRERAPTSSSRLAWVPASYQLVEVWQSNWSGPQFCGAVYTNVAGLIPTGTKFSCGANLPNDVQLVVRGDSARGFRVGFNSPYPHEQFDVAYAFQWATPWLKGQKTLINFDVRKLTASEDLNDPTFRAAALVEILDVVYQELNLGYIVFPQSVPGTLIWSNWIVNDAVSSLFGLTAPWTYNRTVHMPAGSSADYVLDAAAHELGHVLYNQFHSGWDHYSVEVFDYMKSHAECQDYGSHFGSYEGFAHAVYNLAWRQHAVSVGSDEYKVPDPSCTNQGIAVEGNADEFYSYAFAGKEMERPAGSINNWTTHMIGANNYAFPPTAGLWSLVASAGMNQEDLSKMWTVAMSSYCTGSTSGAPKFCGSRRFKCLVKNSMLAPADSFPAEFQNPSCAPGTSNVTSVTRAQNGTYTVAVSPSDYADKYTLEVFDNGATTAKTYSLDTSTTVSGVTLTACKASKLRVRTSIDSPAATALGADYSFTPNGPELQPASLAITAASRGGESPTSTSAWQYSITHATASNAKGYRVYVSTSASATGTAGALHTGAQTTVDLTKGTTYTLRVESQNDCGSTMGPAYTLASDPPAKGTCTQLANGKLNCTSTQLPSTIKVAPLTK
jgi:hypothetical protein